MASRPSDADGLPAAEPADDQGVRRALGHPTEWWLHVSPRRARRSPNALTCRPCSQRPGSPDAPLARLFRPGLPGRRQAAAPRLPHPRAAPRRGGRDQRQRRPAPGGVSPAAPCASPLDPQRRCCCAECPTTSRWRCLRGAHSSSTCVQPLPLRLPSPPQRSDCTVVRLAHVVGEHLRPRPPHRALRLLLVRPERRALLGCQGWALGGDAAAAGGGGQADALEATHPGPARRRHWRPVV